MRIPPGEEDLRLRKLDENYQNAKMNLMLERARGILIGWLNKLKRVDRFCNSSKPEYKKALPYVLLDASSDIATAHMHVHDKALSMVVQDMKERICTKIRFLTGTSDIEAGLSILIQMKKLTPVIEYTKELINLLVQIMD